MFILIYARSKDSMNLLTIGADSLANPNLFYVYEIWKMAAKITIAELFHMFHPAKIKLVAISTL
jgi:hypothetical protein